MHICEWYFIEPFIVSQINFDAVLSLLSILICFHYELSNSALITKSIYNNDAIQILIKVNAASN